MIKKCRKCNEAKDISFFGNRIAFADGKNDICKLCVNKHMRETYRTTHKERIAKEAKEDRKLRPDYYRELWIRHKFKLPFGSYAAMHKKQQGLCAVCGSTGQERRKSHRLLHIDHCHVSGNIRELLCTNCNLGLGNFGEKIEVLLRAIEYLKKHSVIAHE